MSGRLKKRSREDETHLDSVKRFDGGMEKQVLRLLEEMEPADEVQAEQKCGPCEEVVSGVMKNLEEEIGIMSCSASYEGFGDSFGLARDDSVSSDMTSRYETHGGIDLDYLLGAFDDDLGIPPSPLQNVEDQPLSSFPSKDDSFPLCLDFAENAEHKDFVNNWHFEDDFVDYSQFGDFAVDILSEGASIDGLYSVHWGLETASVMY